MKKLLLYSFLILCGINLYAQSTLNLEIKTSKPETAQIFYDMGNGLSEANSDTIKLKGNNDFQRVEFAIPAGNLKSLRFDPLEKSGSVYLRTVYFKSGDKQFNINLDQIASANNIAVNEIREDGLYVETTQEATDPQVIINVTSAECKDFFKRPQTTNNWLLYAIVLISCLFILSIFILFKKHCLPSKVKFTFINYKYFWLSLVTIFSFLFSYNFIRLANGNVLNCYPFISPDGFDWYTEGAYLISKISGANLPPLNVLRPPGFVCITALDYLAGEKGLVIAIFLFIVLIGNYLVTRSIISILKPSSNSLSVNLILFLSFTFYPINFISAWLLADLYAMLFSLLSVFFFFIYLKSERFNKLCFSAGFALMGSLFQTWAYIPFLIACSCFLFLQLSKDRKKSLSCIFATFTSGILHIIIIGCWRLLMPHARTPANFELLRFDFTMVDFYIDVWIFTFGPFLAYIFYSAFMRGRNNEINIKAFFIFLITISFSLLSLLYQWRESRFTYYFFPWFVVLFFAIFRLTNFIEKSLLIVTIFIVCILVPVDYWKPQISFSKISFKHTWFSEYFKAAPVDRNILNQVDNNFLEQSDKYIRSSISTYNLIKLKNNSKID